MMQNRPRGYGETRRVRKIRLTLSPHARDFRRSRLINLVVDVSVGRLKSVLRGLRRSAKLVAYLYFFNVSVAMAEYVPLHERMTAEQCVQLSSTLLAFATSKIDPVIDSLSNNQGRLPSALNEELLGRMEKLRDKITICGLVQYELEKSDKYVGVNFSSISIDFGAIKSMLQRIRDGEIENDRVMQRSVDYLEQTYSRLIRTLKGGSGFPNPMAKAGFRGERWRL